MMKLDAAPRALFLMTSLALAGLTVACGAPPEAAPSEPAANDAVAAGTEEGPDVYHIRGEVITVPVAGDAQSTLSIHHQAIDDYKGIGGEIWGMDSMTMPFEVAEDVDLAGIAPGDKIAFTLEVDWFGDTPQQITAIEKLDPAAEIEFRKARPPVTAADDEPTDETADENGDQPAAGDG